MPYVSVYFFTYIMYYLIMVTSGRQHLAVRNKLQRAPILLDSCKNYVTIRLDTVGGMFQSYTNLCHRSQYDIAQIANFLRNYHVDGLILSVIWHRFSFQDKDCPQTRHSLWRASRNGARSVFQGPAGSARRHSKWLSSNL